MAAPLVSIIVPAHNAEKYLAETVRSLTDQTYRNLEIIIVDDASTDGTLALAHKLAEGDERIVVIHNETNKMRAGALNAGIDAGHGAYIGFLDADDLYMSEKIKKQVAELEAHPELDAVYGDMEHMNEDPSWKPVTEALEFSETFRDALVTIAETATGGSEPDFRIFGDKYIPSCSPLIRRAVFDTVRLDASMRCAEDLDLWLQMIGAGFTMKRMPFVTYRYRRHPGQISNNQECMDAGIAQVREKKQKGTYLKGSRV